MVIYRIHDSVLLYACRSSPSLVQIDQNPSINHIRLHVVSPPRVDEALIEFTASTRILVQILRLEQYGVVLLLVVI